MRCSSLSINILDVLSSICIFRSIPYIEDPNTDIYWNDDLLLLIFDVILFFNFFAGALMNSESLLADFILANYSKQARPVMDLNYPVNVTFGIEIMHFIKLVGI